MYILMYMNNLISFTFANISLIIINSNHLVFVNAVYPKPKHLFFILLICSCLFILLS